jgi:hypothetical protein
VARKRTRFGLAHPDSIGGCMLAMSPNPLIDKKEYERDYKEAADILGMTRFYQGGS